MLIKHVQTKMMVSNNKRFYRTKKLPHMQPLKVRIEWDTKFLSHYLTILDITIIFSLVSNLKKILNFIYNIYIIYIMKHKNVLKKFYCKWFSYTSSFNLYQTFVKPKNVYWTFIDAEICYTINSQNYNTILTVLSGRQGGAVVTNSPPKSKIRV